MSFNKFFISVGALASALTLVIPATTVLAFDREAFEQRRAERQAELAARRAARAAEKAQCSCSAQISFAKPVLQFRSGNLVFIPSINVRVRSRGEERTPWQAHVDLAGETKYSSEDVSVPSGVTFNRSQDIFSGHCGDDMNFTGVQLSPVTLSGLSQGLQDKQEIDGAVKMNATLSACESATTEREFNFTLREFGNLFVRGWHAVRSFN